MSQARVYRNAENFVNGDWLETLPTLKGRFGVILSDLTSGNIPYDDRARFYEEIAYALIDGGMFFDKVLAHTDRMLSIDALIEKYTAMPLNLLYINYFSSEMLFCSEMLNLNQVVDSSLFYAILDERIKNERVRAFAEHAKKITPPGCKWWYGRKWVELQTDYCAQLTQIAVDEDEPSSPYYGYLKLFQFKKG
ncbi:MAG: hypothetical protein ACRD8U_24185 [Pyrinomonadaceae bacterium]